MPRCITDNFFDAQNALRKRTNATMWAILASGLKVKYGNYWSRDNEDKECYWVDSYELPCIWQLMTDRDPVCNVVAGQLTLTEKGKNLLADIVKTYDGKFTIVNAVFQSKGYPPPAMLKDCDNASNYKQEAYQTEDKPNLFVKVQRIVRNKKTFTMYNFDFTDRLHQLAREEGFPRYLALSREKTIKEINGFLTERMRTDMTELMLDTKSNLHVREYVVA